MSAPWKFLPCPNCCGCVCYQDPAQNIDMADNYEVRSGSWLLGSALMPNCNIQTADSNALLVNKNACGGDTPKFGYTAIVSMGVWQPGARLIGAYSDDDNYFYVEGANAADSAANAGATSMRLVQRLAGVETVIGKRLMFTSPGEVTGSLGISWGPYGVRTAGLCPGFPFGSGPFYRGDPGPGLLAGVGTGTITGTAEFYGFGLGKALSLMQYSNIYNLCTGFPECTPCSLADGSTCGELTCTLSGLGTWSQVWGPSADFSPVAGTYIAQPVDDYPPPTPVQQGLLAQLGACFWEYQFSPPIQLTDSAHQTVQVLGFRISLSVRNVAPYTVSVVLGVTLELSWPGWSAFPPYGFSGPLVPGNNSIALLPLFDCSKLSGVSIPIGQGTCVVSSNC